MPMRPFKLAPASTKGACSQLDPLHLTQCKEDCAPARSAAAHGASKVWRIFQGELVAENHLGHTSREMQQLDAFVDRQLIKTILGRGDTATSTVNCPADGVLD